MHFLLFILFLNLINNQKLQGEKYSPDWNSLDSRPLPEWYDRLKVGM